jgi:hypothetical protein
MIPAGYLAKTISDLPDLRAGGVADIYSVSGCISRPFADVQFWKHNGYWFFDSPDVIELLARDNGIDLSATHLFYYEVHEKQYDEGEKAWREFAPWPSLPTNVAIPEIKQLEGFDVVSFSLQNMPECSPLSCNGLAKIIPVNRHCLLATFEEAVTALEAGLFDNSEPGPFRVFTVYSVPRS